MKKKSQQTRNPLRNDLFKNLRSQMKEYTHYVLLNLDLNHFTGGEIRGNAHFFSADFLAGQDLSQLGVAHYSNGSRIFVAVHTMNTGWLLGKIIDTYYGPEYAYPKNATSRPPNRRKNQKPKAKNGVPQYNLPVPSSNPNRYQPQYGPKSSPEIAHA